MIRRLIDDKTIKRIAFQTLQRGRYKQLKDYRIRKELFEIMIKECIKGNLK